MLNDFSWFLIVLIFTITMKKNIRLLILSVHIDDTTDRPIGFFLSFWTVPLQGFLGSHMLSFWSPSQSCNSVIASRPSACIYFINGKYNLFISWIKKTLTYLNTKNKFNIMKNVSRELQKPTALSRTFVNHLLLCVYQHCLHLQGI